MRFENQYGHQRARATYERALADFAAARDAREQFVVLKPFMLTDDYDEYLGQRAWELSESGRDRDAEYTQNIRYMLRTCQGSEDVAQTLADFGRFNDPPPRHLQPRLAQWWELTGEAPAEPTLARAHRDKLIDILHLLLNTPGIEQMGTFFRCQAHLELGTSFYDRAKQSRSLDDLDAGAESIERAVRLAPPCSPWLPTYYINAANIFNLRFGVAHTLQDADIALSNAEFAVMGLPRYELATAAFYSIYGAALRNIAEIANDACYWNAAACGDEQAVGYERAGTAAHQKYRENAVTARLQAGLAPSQRRLPKGLQGSTFVEHRRAMETADEQARNQIVNVPKIDVEVPSDAIPSTLDAAVEDAEKALDVLPDTGSSATARKCVLAGWLFARGVAAGDSGDFRRALRLVDDVLSCDATNVDASRALSLKLCCS